MTEYEVFYTDSLRVTAESVSDAERKALNRIRAWRHPATAWVDPDAMRNVRVTTIQQILETP